MQPVDAKSLFRPEVFEARSQGWLGGISLAQPLHWRVLAGAALALAAAALGLLAFGSYAPHTRVPGSLVAPAATAMPLQAELRVPARTAAALEPGDAILLRLQDFPYQRFGHVAGRVAGISAHPLPVPGSAGGNGAYQVLVDLERQAIVADGKPVPLQPGMRLQADLRGERRRLYQWVLAPLLP